jgi:hypothetical protein
MMDYGRLLLRGTAVGAIVPRLYEFIPVQLHFFENREVPPSVCSQQNGQGHYDHNLLLIRLNDGRGCILSVVD